MYSKVWRRDKGENERKRKWGGFSAEEEKEPSLCPEKAALLSRAECDQERDKHKNDKTGPRVGAGHQDPRGVGAMAYDWWTIMNEGLCFRIPGLTRRHCRIQYRLEVIILVQLL